MPNLPIAEARKIAQYLEDQATETNDGMTADPETATEDAFLSITVNGTDYEIPLYSA